MIVYKNGNPRRARQGAHLADCASTKLNWRDHLPIHPAAELLPRMSSDELKDLAANIQKVDLLDSVALFEDPDGNYSLLDGISRLDALESLGRDVIADSNFKFATGQVDHQERDPDAPIIFHVENGYDDNGKFDPYAFVFSKNYTRRHLNASQKREVIVKLLKLDPEKSNVQIAKTARADDKTVAKVRTKLESTSEIPKLKTTKGKDGKSRPIRRKTDQSARQKLTTITGTSIADVSGTETALINVENSAEKRKAQNSNLALTDDEKVTKSSAHYLSEFTQAAHAYLPKITVAADQEKARELVARLTGAITAADALAETVH